MPDKFNSDNRNHGGAMHLMHARAFWQACAVVLVALTVWSLLVAGASAASVPTLQVSPASGDPGTSVVAVGTGFAGHQTLTFTWDGQPTASPSARTASNGSFKITLVLPNLPPGNHTLGATAGKTHASAVIAFSSPLATITATATSTSTSTAQPTSTPTPALTSTPTPAPVSTSTVVPAVTPSSTPSSSGPSLAGCPVFPVDNIWNTRVDTLPVSPLSASYIASIGSSVGLHPDFGTVWNGAPNGIPFVTVPGTQPRVAVQFTYADESDPGPYPIPPNAPIEGGTSSTGDRHVLVVDRDACTAYELYSAYPQADGSWSAGSGAVFSLTSDALRPAGWTSADAAGLPVLPGLARYDEVVAGTIAHALRFTAAVTQRAYDWPARHYASSNTSSSVPPMGIRVRLKSSVDISSFSPANQVILQALKTYGMMLADNGSNWYMSGAPDSRWNDSDLALLHHIVGANLEVVDTSPLMIQADSAQARTP